MQNIVPIRGDSPETQHAVYTPAIRYGDLVFVSGQVAMDSEGNSVALGDFRAQGEVVFRRLSEILTEAGSSMENILKVSIFLRSVDDFPDLVELRRKWFTAPYPADTTVVVESLVRPECLIEVEAIAAVSQQNRPEGDA